MTYDSASRVLPVVVEISERLRLIPGRALLIGCSVPAIELLSSPRFDLNVFAIDRDMGDIEASKSQLVHIPGMQQRLSYVADDSLPFDDDFFSVLIWAEPSKLASASPESISVITNEVNRVLRPGGTAVFSIDIDTESTANDSIARWSDTTNADRIEWDRVAGQMLLWSRSRVVSRNELPALDTAGTREDHPPDSKILYQQIYDQNQWYGNAEEDRCPGVRLLPDYQDWLIGPVIDLGCGRGHVVQKLREANVEAEGIDQIVCNPDMRVGDITKPINDIKTFKSAICIDCIEHLYEEQVIGLFENMRQTERQAFSIHNGESTGTGQELHVNRKDFIDWTKMIREYFEIASAIQIHENQVLYLTRAL
jgi:SAM-dependent methyltransferase